MTCVHLHSVGQRRVQHGEHSQIGAEVRHHATAEALEKQMRQQVYVQASVRIKIDTELILLSKNRTHYRTEQTSGYKTSHVLQH